MIVLTILFAWVGVMAVSLVAVAYLETTFSWSGKFAVGLLIAIAAVSAAYLLST